MATERATLESDLREGLQRCQLVLYYQPQVELSSGKVTGVEALLRWQHPDMGLLPPGTFIAAAVLFGYMLTSLYLTQTLAQAIALGKLPREVGIHPETKEKISAGIGRFGPYLKHGKEFISLKSDDVLEVGLNRAVTLIAEHALKPKRKAPPKAEALKKDVKKKAPAKRAKKK